MNRIIYACPWTRDKKKSWSGTHWGLYSALKKEYEIHDVDTGLYHRKNISIKMMNLFTRIKSKAPIFKDDMGMIRISFMNSKLEREMNRLRDPVIQFDECPKKLEGRKQYIYQDLSVGYVKKLYEENYQLFQYSGFVGHSIKNIIKREQRQQLFYNSVDGIFTMSQWLRDELITLYGLDENKVHHVGGGYNLNPELIDYSKKTGNKILFVGRDFERKNGKLVIDSFLLARETLPYIELYIAGPRKLEQKNEGIHFLGDLTQEELVKYFNLCDVFCMPSKFEAYGLVFPEALIFGLPCIGRNAYEMPHFIKNGETGYLLEKENKEELAELMIKTINSEQIKMTVRSNKDKYLYEYSWDTVVSRMNEYI